jgi:hypothetical protein
MGVYHGQRQTKQFLKKRGVTPSDIHGRLLAVERKRLQTALCSAEYGAYNVARKLNSRLSVSGIATPLKKGVADPPGS